MKINEETIEELLAYKVVKTSEEKMLKIKQKKLDKKLKCLEKSDAKHK